MTNFIVISSCDVTQQRESLCCYSPFHSLPLISFAIETLGQMPEEMVQQSL